MQGACIPSKGTSMGLVPRLGHVSLHADCMRFSFGSRGYSFGCNSSCAATSPSISPAVPCSNSHPCLITVSLCGEQIACSSMTRDGPRGWFEDNESACSGFHVCRLLFSRPRARVRLVCTVFHGADTWLGSSGSVVGFLCSSS